MNVNIVLQFYYKLVTFIDLGKNTCYNRGKVDVKITLCKKWVGFLWMVITE
ncbi:hypothetical protein ACETAC_09310 [Aceticella autotrophica]|uniref:Uncharacterized protein n=1 Tax=Aceticella autotrophica TaxID=2755338 RepID=A0A975AV79_9THEO|nr:hypothetical protein [Aceticella autotrophica]QSZ27052.1 hypothetical protein ACETAC_09310 [Aceticella autotrophica]